jgi:hypothetical protein
MGFNSAFKGLICHSSTLVDVFHKGVNVDVCHTSVMFKCNSTPRLQLICHSSMTVDVYHTSEMLAYNTVQIVADWSLRHEC